ncbi:phage head morphogenesis protein [Ruegeria atlantica]|uniref:phage head morphogenesis protein n=1 Tax=Ruegeria atlantica TaxID=81569 RepID=UPI00147F5B8E|nr:phage minor head protein [Ruegeria atlantica]
MADALDLTPVVAPVSVTPQEALEYFRAKGFAPPDSRFSYLDWWGASHARGFVVAKVMQDDLLRDIRDAVNRAIAEGQTLEQFRAELQPLLKRKGWWGRKVMTDTLTGEVREVQLGSARRLRVIFDTNMRTSYAAGRWVRIQRTKKALPYLQYIQMERINKRKSHKPFHGLVIHVDNLFWVTNFPPNGYFCGCTTIQLSAAAVDRRGLTVTTDPPVGTREWTNPRTGEIIQLPEGITPGFDTNPGATFLAEQRRYERIAGDLPPTAGGTEAALISEARARGLRTGNEHLAAIDLDPDESHAIGDIASVAPIEWVTGTRDGVEPTSVMSAAMSDPARRIGVVHNHPNSSGFSKQDLLALDFYSGLERLIAVGHDGTLYRASNPRPGLSTVIDPLYRYSESLVNTVAANLGMDAIALFNLRGHATASALARAGYLDYAHAITGGSRVNLERFGEANMSWIIERLVEWLTQ